MNTRLHVGGDKFFHEKAISPLLELGAYEALWAENGATTFKKIADIFREHSDSLPSDLVSERVALKYSQMVLEKVRAGDVRNFGVRIHKSIDYPAALRDAVHPPELLYYQGQWDLIYRPCVAVVGTRRPTRDGERRTRRIVRWLVKKGFAVVSGLARGVDTIAHTTALKLKGHTIAVLGMPLTRVYPRENRDLQARIAEEQLVISQVPFIKHARSNLYVQRMFFPERNVTMSALTRATVIVEASDTSGTLVQAHHAIKQGRKLLILESCFKRGLKWPEKMVAKGAIRVRDEEQLSEVLGDEMDQD